MWKCQECARTFRTVNAAQKASLNGCPGCGGVDIDLDVDENQQTERHADDPITERLKRVFLTRKPKEDQP